MKPIIQIMLIMVVIMNNKEKNIIKIKGKLSAKNDFLISMLLILR